VGRVAALDNATTTGPLSSEINSGAAIVAGSGTATVVGVGVGDSDGDGVGSVQPWFQIYCPSEVQFKPATETSTVAVVRS
jgi:hypothetical protein